MNESFELDIPVPVAKAWIRAPNTLNFCAELKKVVCELQEQCRLTAMDMGV